MESLKDYKAWIQERAEEIVTNLFITPFGRTLDDDWHETWERHKDWAYRIAMKEYKDAYADQVDWLCDLSKELRH